MSFKLKAYGLVAGIALLFSIQVAGQDANYNGIPSNIWPILYDISYKTVEDEFGALDKPIFTKAVKALEGQTIIIPGYIIPFDGTGQSNSFMFSSLPLNACFFCGVGGPETVVQIKSAKKINYNDKPVEIQGKLVLNTDDPDQHFYILDNAKYLGEFGL